MIGAVRDYAMQHTDSTIQRVVFVLYTMTDYRIFNREAERGEAQ